MGKRKKVIKDSSDEEESGSESSSASSSSESSSAASSSVSTSSSESGSESSRSSSPSSSEEDEKTTKKKKAASSSDKKKKSEPVTPTKKKAAASSDKKKIIKSDGNDDDKKKKKTKKDISEEKSSMKKKQHKKKKKDPNAPKRPITAFIQFSNKMRDTAKERLTSEGKETTPKAVVTKLGEMWKALTEEQKKPYNDEAKKDKDRYETEIAKYVPPEPSESDSESSGGEDGDGKRKKKKVKKDPNAPKKNKSSYIIFTEVNREKVAEELKKKMGESFTNKEVMKEMGKRWGALPEKEKEQYKILADEDKKRYETELANYKSKK